jgi:hypothetical protein
MLKAHRKQRAVSQQIHKPATTVEFFSLIKDKITKQANALEV